MVLTIGIVLAFVFAQGAAVFATAVLALRLLRTAHWLGKVVAMAASYLAWIAFTAFLFSREFEGFGFMEGGAVFLLVCASALVSTFAYLLAWMIAPAFRGRSI